MVDQCPALEPMDPGRRGACDAKDRTSGARTWMSWLLLAVFVVLAGRAPRSGAAQVQRQNDQAFAAQAASIGASATTAVAGWTT